MSTVFGFAGDIMWLVRRVAALYSEQQRLLMMFWKGERSFGLNRKDAKKGVLFSSAVRPKIVWLASLLTMSSIVVEMGDDGLVLCFMFSHEWSHCGRVLLERKLIIKLYVCAIMVAWGGVILQLL